MTVEPPLAPAFVTTGAVADAVELLPVSSGLAAAALLLALASTLDAKLKSVGIASALSVARQERTV